jgi:hypothetical protein
MSLNKPRNDLLALDARVKDRTWFKEEQEERAAISKKQRGNLTKEQRATYIRESTDEIPDLIQLRRDERREAVESSGFWSATAERLRTRYPAGSEKHWFQRVGALAFDVVDRNKDFRDRIFEFFDDEARRGATAAELFTGLWETIVVLADDVLDEAIDVIDEERGRPRKSA